jgi:hypothetical protein
MRPGSAQMICSLFSSGGCFLAHGGLKNPAGDYQITLWKVEKSHGQSYSFLVES